MHCSKKNSYLQSIYAEIKPEILNRCIDKTRNLKQSDPHDGEPPFQRLCSQQPQLIVENIDLTRRRCGYGKQAFHQLKKDLNSYDVEVVMKAVSTIGDLILDPEKACLMIKLRIHESLCELLDTKNKFLIERVFGTLNRLANIPNGKIAIAKSRIAINSFKRRMKEEDNVRVLVKLGKCLDNLSNFMTSADELVDQGFICTIIDVMANENDDVTVLFLSTLKNLIYGSGSYIAMEYGAFPLIVLLLNRIDDRVQTEALNCLMKMTSTPLGKRSALDCDLLQILTNMLWYSENPELDTAITSVTMFCTILPEAKQRACHIKGLIPRLMKVCRNPAFATTQMYAMMTLSNLAVQYKQREIIRNKYLFMIRKTKCANPMVSRIRENLLNDLADFS